MHKDRGAVAHGGVEALAESGKTGAIAVTGASRGIGAAIAVELARRGFTVGCLSRAGNGPQDVEFEAGLAERLINARADVTDEASMAAAYEIVADPAGGLAGLVNNAGVLVEEPSESMTNATFNAVMSTNATGVFTASRLAYPHLVENGGGTIVNIGSFWERLGIKRGLAYCASKAAVGAMTRCLAVEWAGQGIRVVNVAPGYIETDLNREMLAQPKVQEFLARRIPVKRPGTPDEVARLVASLFQEDLGFLTGETIYMDGGQTIVQ